MLDDGTCVIGGCIDVENPGYQSFATFDDGSCPIIFRGCMHRKASNFRRKANVDSGKCKYRGCLDSTKLNYNPTATVKGRCIDIRPGCMDPDADNYWKDSNKDSGTCIYN
eukprot:5286948-Prymnesium_polylepis.1